MQKTSKISFGPGAASIILIVVILCMSVLGLLSLVNSQNDIHLSERSSDVIEAVYELNARAQISLSELDALVKRAESEAADEKEYLEKVASNLPSGMTLEEQTISWTEMDDYRCLECQVLLNYKGAPRLTWINHRMSIKTEESWNLGSF